MFLPFYTAISYYLRARVPGLNYLPLSRLLYTDAMFITVPHGGAACTGLLTWWFVVSPAIPAISFSSVYRAPVRWLTRFDASGRFCRLRGVRTPLQRMAYSRYCTLPAARARTTSLLTRTFCALHTRGCVQRSWHSVFHPPHRLWPVPHATARCRRQTHFATIFATVGDAITTKLNHRLCNASCGPSTYYYSLDAMDLQTPQDVLAFW
jgi:hypothetical protein